MKKFLAVFAVIALVAFAAPAFAANPFMDVPAGHWAYDAVAQLAARGVVSGYPDGAFKGAQPATRYEVASVVARALAKIDAEKASKQDLEMLKKLVMEFKDELDALGVKVDKIDKRVAVLEDRLGGWKLNGELRFDAKWASDGDDFVNDYAGGRDVQFNNSRLRIHVRKFIDDNSLFYGRLNGTGAAWDRWYVQTKLPYDVRFTAGQFNMDWEGDYGLYNGGENDGTFTDFTVQGFEFMKQWGMVNARLVVARNFSLDTDGGDVTWTDPTHMMYALNLHADFNEKFRGGLMAYYLNGDAALAGEYAGDIQTYGVYGGFDFTPAVTFQGIYYMQKIDDLAAGTEDSPKMWKAQLNFKQDLLKFTSLWIEYSQEDNTFLSLNQMDGGSGAYDWSGNTFFLANRGWNNGTSKILFVRADQKWNDKWSSFLRYAQADVDAVGTDDTKMWTVGIAMQYTPAINFQLAYDQIDYGTGNVATGGSLGRNGTESVVRFRTYVSF